MLRRAGTRHPTLEQRRRYQADCLGRRNGDTLLTELLPYPHSDSGQWLYAQFGRYPTRQKYEEALVPRRRAMLQRIFAEHPPELIIAHGKANWPHYKTIFGETTWRADGLFEYADRGDTRIVLAHQLSGRQFNTDEQLDRFADITLQGASAVPSRAEGMGETTLSTSNSNSSTEEARRRANRHVRDVFGVFARTYRTASTLSPEQVSDKAREFEGQGNPGGVRNLESSYGWVDPGFAEGVFRAIGIPEAAKLGRAYADLKMFFGGVTKEKD